MSLLRRFEMIFGGPARPFPLTVSDAHVLANACEAYAESYGSADLPPEDENDVRYDAEHLVKVDELRRRLYLHAGFDRVAREEVRV